MSQPAARVGDMHVCPMVTGIVPHVGGPVLPPGCPTVLIGGMPAARVGDMAVCTGPPDVIIQGCPTVLIGGMPAARMGDMTAHGGTIVMGFPTVLIGAAASGGGGAPGPTGPPAPPPVKTPEELVDEMLADGTIVIEGTDEYKAAVRDDLITIASTDSGRGMLEDMQSTGQSVTITDWPPGRSGNFCRPNDSGAYPAPHGTGAGTGSTVGYNPNQANRPPGSPAVAGLNHELGHATNNAQGVNARHTPYADPSTAPRPSNMEEHNTITNWDNPFRREMGLPERNGHGHLP